MNVTLPRTARRSNKPAAEKRKRTTGIPPSRPGGYGGVAVHADAHRPLLLRYSAVHSTQGRGLRCGCLPCGLC